MHSDFKYLEVNLDLISQIAILFQNYIITYTLFYFLGIGSVLSIINNVLVILTFLFGKESSKNISPSIRIYYIVIALSDLNVTFSLYLIYFFGMTYS